MRLAIFGLTVTSSWGNGHATIWRALCSALAKLGHRITFFERDVSYYANHRDLQASGEYDVVLYSEWNEVRSRARAVVAESDCAIVTSYCPDSQAACDVVLSSAVPLKAFYDLDTPVTLNNLRRSGNVDYIPSYGLKPFDLVLSYTGGRALDDLREMLGARKVAPLYGTVDPRVHTPVPPNPKYHSDLSYLGTYAADRQFFLEELFLEPARRSPHDRFLIGGACYPEDFPWQHNVWFVHHVPPGSHPEFYCSSRLTLNITRSAMAEMGYCPSGRLFEAAACGTPIVTDSWPGLREFFEPGQEILLASSASQVVEALALSPEELRRIGNAARERVLAEHTAEKRCEQLIELLEVYA